MDYYSTVSNKLLISVWGTVRTCTGTDEQGTIAVINT